MATIRKPKYKLSEFRKQNYNKPLNRLTPSQREKYDNYKEYIQDYKGAQRERKQASQRALYESTSRKIKGKTPKQALNIWANYGQKKEKIQERYEDSIEQFYTTFKVREKKLQTVDQVTFKSRKAERYAKNKRLQETFQTTEGYAQVIIEYKDSNGNIRYYSKTYFNDPDTFDSSMVDDWIEDTLDFFEDDSESYNADGYNSIAMVFTSPAA
jgi:hypothetical protein